MVCKWYLNNAFFFFKKEMYQKQLAYALMEAD